jgi:polysaccharide export outer membrane protein
MMFFGNASTRCLFGLLAVWLMAAGCETTRDFTDATATPPRDNTTEVLRAGDKIVVVLSDIPPAPLTFELTISEDGKISIHQNQEFIAAGKTTRVLEKEIHERYVPKQYTHLTPTVRFQDRFFFVNGEVRNPYRYVYSTELTVLKAIATAGGFTDYAKRTKVVVTRVSGKQETVNCDKAKSNPKLDVPIYPGDQIHVPRRL